MPRPSKLPPYEEIERIRNQEGLTDAQLAERFGASVRGIEAARLRWKRRDEPKAEEGLPPWPWTISARHAGYYTYRAMLALRKYLAGDALSTDERRMALEVRDRVDALKAVVTYSPDEGFRYAKRRPEDGDRVFVAR